MTETVKKKFQGKRKRQRPERKVTSELQRDEASTAVQL